MSLLVRYTLKSADDHDNQISAMVDLVNDLIAEGVAGVHYSCFSTGEATEFVGLMEFDEDAGKQAFLSSAAFAAYKEKVGPTFANPPQTTVVTALASTKG